MKQRYFLNAIFVSLFLSMTAFGQDDVETPDYPPTSEYEEMEIEGWTVRVNGRLLSDEPELAEETLTILRHQLYSIKRNVPGEAVEKIQTIPIWLELRDPAFPGTAYHPDRDWLTDHGLNPDKTGCVEIGTARDFKRYTLNQPWVMLHELAHGYHDQFLEGGFRQSDILAAYHEAMEAGIYEEVLQTNGRNGRHYATTNQMEYFAEATEAFFGSNNYYPFVNAELREHDARIYEVVKQVWGVQ